LPKTALCEGQPGENRHRQRQTLKLQVPVVMKGKSLYLDTFINDVFQSGLDQTFQVEKRPHPLNALSADEIKQAVEIVKASADFKPNTRFTQIALAEPESQSVGLCATVRRWIPAPAKVSCLMANTSLKAWWI
jgi:primary-amine oxidase